MFAFVLLCCNDITFCSNNEENSVSISKLFNLFHPGTLS